jgi:predicted RND superfamily exporter protein
MTRLNRGGWDERTEWLARHRWGLLILAAIVSALLIPPALHLKLDESIESFYAPDDPFLLAYLQSKQTFGGDEFVMVGYEIENPTSEAELKRIKEFADKLSSVPGIHAESTQDLASMLRNPRASGLLRVVMRLPSTSRGLLDLSRRVLIGDGEKAVAIILRLEEESKSPVPRAVTFRRIRQLAREHQPPAAVAGESIQVNDMFRYVERDGRVLGLASSCLLMTVILVFFRSLRWVLLPLLIIQVVLLWTYGSLELTGMRLSMVSSMIRSLVTIITIATVMHVTVNFREFRENFDRWDSFKKTFARLAMPIFWTSVTTAIGFGALLTSKITPVRSFAVMMALATMLVPLLCLLMLPGGILIGRAHADPRSPLGEAAMLSQLRLLARWSVRHPIAILLVMMACSTAAVLGLLKLTVETDFSKNFRDSAPIVQSLRFFESHLGGVGTWEIGFDVPHELSQVDLDKVRELTEHLRDLKLADGTQLTKVISLTDGLDLVPRVPLGENERSGLFRAIPRFRQALLDEQIELLNELQPEMIPSLYNSRAGRMRIVLRALEQQPAEVKLKLIEAVRNESQQYFPEAQATGLYVLLAYLISSLLQDQLASFALASFGVAVSMAIAFRNVRIGIISLVPNVLPILLVIGGMGWVGIPINIGTAMIASVSMGLTVDSTIHYLTVYQQARRQGEDHAGAVATAHGSVGLTLTLANVALVIGFSVLSLSQFVPLVYFGVLVSVAMLGGLLCNLLVLPVLLRASPAPSDSLPQSAIPVISASEA